MLINDFINIREVAEDNSELGGGGYCQFRIQGGGGGGVSKYSKLGVVGVQ